MSKKKIIIPSIIVLAVVILFAVVAMASPTANSYLKYYVLGKKEINNIYIYEPKEGAPVLIKPFGEIKEKSISWMADRMAFINEEYLSESNVYYSIIPDKGYYAMDDPDFTYIDFNQFEKALDDKVNSYAKYIDIKDELNISNFYLTDPHWKHETLSGVSDKLIEQMGGESGFIDALYEKGEIASEAFSSDSFSGSYFGVYYDKVKSLSLYKKCAPEALMYMKGDYIDNLVVTNFATGKPEIGKLYDFNVVPKENYYEFYLMGNQSLITIDNPNAKSDKELIVFRDSFGSSIAPYLTEGYSKVTLVDIRYLSASRLADFIDFHGQDVLFLYSASVINNSSSQIKK